MTSVTYIVSAFNRPQALRCCLASIQCQTDQDFEVIVADNANDRAMQWRNREMTDLMFDPRFQYIYTASESNPAWDCYWSAEFIVSQGFAHGEFIALPSDDSYMVPIFQEVMLGAARANDLQLVYADMLYDRRGAGKYHHKIVAPRVCEIDKTCFMLRRDCWIGFPNKPTEPKASSCDGEMIEQLVRDGIRHGRVAEMLVVHS